MCQTGVLAQHSARVTRRIRRPTLPSTRQLGVIDQQVQPVAGHVDADSITVANECDRSSVDRLGSHVTDAKAPRSAAESAVGDEGAIGAATGTFQRSGDGQHFAHSRSALGALVTNDEHGVGSNLTGHDGGHRTVLSVEHARGAFEESLFGGEPGHLHHTAERRQRSAQNKNAAFGVDGGRQRMHHHAIGCRRREFGQVLGHGLSGAGEHIAMNETSVEKMLQHHGHSTHAMQVGHVELSAGLHVGDVRNLGRDAVEILEFQRHAGFGSDGQQVQHGVRASSERVGDGDGVLERLLREDVARTNAETQHVHHGLAGASCVVLATAIDGGSRRRAG